MNIWNRITAALLAGACLAGLAMPAMPGAAEEAAYDPCDVDRNGTVNLLDVVLFSKYLNGLISDPDYAKYDANQNLVVDALDGEYILAVCTKNNVSVGYYSKRNKSITMPNPVNVDNAVYPSDLGNSIKYRRYSYELNKELDPYFLPPTDNKANDVSTLSMIDWVDPRKLSEDAPENTGIVYLEGHGTGFIVGDHQIAAAAHSVLTNEGENNKFVKKFNIRTYDENGKFKTNKETDLTAVEVHVPDQNWWDGKTECDYALITVKEDLSDYVHFNLGEAYNLSASYFNNVPIYITGVPTDVKVTSPNGSGGITNDNLLYYDEGYVIGENPTAKNVYTSCFTTYGDSGAPIFTITKYTIGRNQYVAYTALGILHGGYDTSEGVRFTKPVVDFYLHNPHIAY